MCIQADHLRKRFMEITYTPHLYVNLKFKSLKSKLHPKINVIHAYIKIVIFVFLTNQYSGSIVFLINMPQDKDNPKPYYTILK